MSRSLQDRLEDWSDDFDFRVERFIEDARCYGWQWVVLKLIPGQRAEKLRISLKEIYWLKSQHEYWSNNSEYVYAPVENYLTRNAHNIFISQYYHNRYWWMSGSKYQYI